MIVMVVLGLWPAATSPRGEWGEETLVRSAYSQAWAQTCCAPGAACRRGRLLEEEETSWLSTVGALERNSGNNDSSNSISGLPSPACKRPPPLGSLLSSVELTEKTCTLKANPGLWIILSEFIQILA